MRFRFRFRIQGIPCQIEVTSYTKGCPAQTYGPAEDCYPAESDEIAFNVLDQRGRKAEWLERKIQVEDEEAIIEEYRAIVRDEASEHRFQDLRDCG